MWHTKRLSSLTVSAVVTGVVQWVTWGAAARAEPVTFDGNPCVIAEEL